MIHAELTDDHLGCLGTILTDVIHGSQGGAYESFHHSRPFFDLVDMRDQTRAGNVYVIPRGRDLGETFFLRAQTMRHAAMDPDFKAA